MTTVKPGLKTTEFWVTFIQAMVGPVVMFGVAQGWLKPDTDAPEFVAAIGSVAEAVIGLGALGMSAWAVSSYSRGRSEVKAAQIDSESVAALTNTRSDS